MDEPQTGDFKPPYMSFHTLWSTLAELGTKELPPRIDRSLMATKSGTDQANLLAAFAAFNLVGEGQRVQPALVALTSQDEEERRQALAQLVRTHYPRQMEISEQHGTEMQLRESFQEDFKLDSAETRRKAITFFLHAARTAGLPLSQNFPQTRAGSGSPGTPRRRSANGSSRKKAPAAPTTAPNGSAGAATSGDTYTVTLSSGGHVSVVVDVNLFGLSTADREFVIDLVDRLKGYPQAGLVSAEDREEVPVP